jgi:hypothetical protein
MARRAGNYLLGAEYSMEPLSKLLTREVRELKQGNPLQKSNKEQSTKREQEKEQREFPVLLARRTLVFKRAPCVTCIECLE